MKYFYVLVLVSLFCNSNTVSAQKRQLIEGDFSGLTFDQIIERIEHQTSYHFFYKPAWTDSLNINYSVKNKSLKEVLDQFFQGTDLHYTIDAHDQVFITREREIFAGLPDNYFNDDRSDRTRKIETFDFSEYEKREK